MSAYIETHTPMIEKDLLIEALCRMGFRQQQIQVYSAAKNLTGYYSSRQSAEIIIPKQSGKNYYDIGFKETPTGYRVIVDKDDLARGYDKKWQNQLVRHYETLLRQREETEERRRKEAELEAKRLAELKQREETEERRRKEAELEAKRLAEEEARRKAEEARKKLIQTQKQMIIQRAEKMNYMVKEQQVGGEVQPVLIRRHY